MTQPIEPVVKPHRGYLFCRWYCAIILPIWWTAGAVDFTLAQGPSWMPRLALLMLPALFMIFNLMAFPFKHSVFGRFSRSRPPAVDTPIERSLSGGCVGLLIATWPFFTWRAYEHGFGFSVLGVGSGYVPYECVVEVKRSLFYGSLVKHESSEVRSPLRVPLSRVAAAISEAHSDRRSPGELS